LISIVGPAEVDDCSWTKGGCAIALSRVSGANVGNDGREGTDRCRAGAEETVRARLNSLGLDEVDATEVLRRPRRFGSMGRVDALLATIGSVVGRFRGNADGNCGGSARRL
jgi:hypothetical protein